MTITDTPVDSSVVTEVEQFIFNELLMLDEFRYRDWLDLFAEDGLFWLPSNLDDYDPAKHTSIIYNDKNQLAMRIKRLEMGRVVQEIRSRLAHQVSNLLILEDDGEVITARVVLTIFEVQRSRKSMYPGHCIYKLRRTDEGLKIVLKKQCLIDNDTYYQHLAFMV